MSTSDRRAELEAAIDDDPSDRDAYQVLADHLQQLGDPRGELIALQLAEPSDDVHARTKRLIATHGYDPGPPLLEVEWGTGYLDHAMLDPSAASPDALRGALDHPSSRFLRSLHVRPIELGLQTTIDALAVRPRPALGKGPGPRHALDAEACDLGQLEALWPALPNLRALEITGQNVGVGNLPSLTALTIRTIALRPPLLEAVVAAPSTNLETLNLWFGHAQPDRAVLDRLLAHPFPALRWLRLGLHAADELIEPLAGNPLLSRLCTLCLHDGVTDRGADLLLAHADAFAHLRSLDLSSNALSKDAVRRLQARFPQVRVDFLRELDERDSDLYDY